MPCYKIHISGAVFKTGFRYYLKDKADLLGVNGLVFYEDDKSVGVIASCSEGKINIFLDLCKAGFSPVHIEKTKIIEIPNQKFSSFEVVDDKPESLGLLKE